MMSKSSTECIVHVKDRAFNDRRYFVDCSKLENLGWSQKVDWHEGLVSWCCRQFELWYILLHATDVFIVIHTAYDC